jgi:hypothetical protein
MGMAGTHRTESKNPGKKPSGKKRTADVIVAEIEATCLNINKNVSALEKYVKPANLAAKSLGTVGAFFLDKDGELRIDRVVAVVSAGAGLFGLLSRSRKD